MHTATHRETAGRRLNRGFFMHLAVFAGVNLSLAALNFTRNPNRPWFLWVLGGWGLGILAHAAAVFASTRARERAVNRIAARLERRERRQQRREARRADGE